MLIFLKPFVFIFLISFILHFMPNLGIPLSSDVNWIFRLQLDENVRSLPQWAYNQGAYHGTAWGTFLEWHQFTGRYNFLDWYLFRMTAFSAQDKADLWRLIDLVFNSLAVGFFYLILRGLSVPKLIRMVLTLSLILAPFEIWSEYRTSESKAILFLMAGYFLILRADRYWAVIASAVLMIMAVLTKESFFGVWVLVGALIFMKEGKISRKFIYKSSIHLIFVVLVALSFLMIKFYGRAEAVTYAFARSNLQFSIFEYIVYNVWNLVPLIVKNNWWFFILAIFGIGLILDKNLTQVLKKSLLNQRKILLLGLVASILLSILPYLLTLRNLDGRYLLPANFLVAMSLGVIVTPFWKGLTSKFSFKIGKFFQAAIVSLLFLFLMGSDINSLVMHSRQERINQTAWQSFVYEVFVKAPKDGHVILLFDDAEMAEIADSLEANILMKKREDLTFHLHLDKQSFERASVFTRKTIENFNKGRKVVEKNDKVLTVFASRSSKLGEPYLNYEIF